MKCSSNLDIDWFYIAWKVWHAARFCLPAIPSTFKGMFFLNSCIFWSFRDGKTKNDANVSECLYKVTSVTSNVALHFAPLATSPNFGSSDSIGSLKGQSEMTLNGMSSDPNNAVKQFGSGFNEIAPEGAVWSGAYTVCIFWMHYSIVQPHCSNFRTITATLWVFEFLWRLSVVQYLMSCYISLQ